MSTNALLMAWCQSRDESAFQVLFRRHYEPIYRILYRMVGDQADDLAQEVFLRLYDRPPLQTDTNLGGWLHRVAVRLGYNMLRANGRREQRRERLGSSTTGAGWLTEAIDPEESAERHQTQWVVRRVLGKLKQRQASILVLRYSGLSYREIAEALQIKPSSVGTLLARAEAAFAREYERATSVGTRGANA
jgi:RNA polymerase sigma-70 factor (ECF subfamily)